MRRLFLVGVLVACSPSAAENEPWPEPLEENLVLTWSASYPGGEDRFRLARNGESFFDRRFVRHIEVERTLSEASMMELRDDLRAAQCCAYVGPWADMEHMIEFRVRMPGLSCDLHIPAHAFDLDPHIRAHCGDRLAEEWGRPRYRAPTPNDVVTPG